MEPIKLQVSKLFTHTSIDFRDKIEEVMGNLNFSLSFSQHSQPFFSHEKRDVLKFATNSSVC